MSSQSAKPSLDESADAYVTTLVLGLAAWLIFNSHLEAFYPLPWLAADGLLGNTLFFVISGLGIFSSLNKRRQGFGDYVSRRFWRLYPAVMIVLAFQIFFISRTYSADLSEIIHNLIWPTPFTYIAIIVPMYLLAFASHRLLPNHAAVFLGSLCLLSYGLGFSQSIHALPTNAKLSIGTLPQLVSYGYFGFAFCLGGVIAGRKSFAKYSWAGLLLIVFVMTLYVVLKYLMVVRGTDAIAYPILHILVLILCLLALKVLCAPGLVHRILAVPVAGSFLRLSGGLSLEIYLVHAVLLNVAFFPAIMFPLNILVFAAVTFVLAILLQRLTRWIQERLEK